MRGLSKAIFWAGGLVLGVGFVWRLMFPTFAWHQRLTLVVETPAGEVTGSSVSAVRVLMGPELLRDAPSIGVQFTGEAAFVEVAPGRYLFALVRNGAGWASDTFTPVSEGRDFVARMQRIEAAVGEPARDVPRDRWPVLVTFDDVRESTTVRRVAPGDLAAVFGEGVRLKAVTLEITRDAVTEGPLDGLLWWLGPYPEPGLGPATGGALADAPFYRRVRMGDFIRRP